MAAANCVFVDRKVQDLLDAFKLENKESIKIWIALWQRDHNNYDTIPTSKQLLQYISKKENDHAIERIFKGVIVEHPEKNATREEAGMDTDTLYIFNENGDNTNGSIPITVPGPYEGKLRPTKGPQSWRGLHNAFPITTKKHRGGENARWNDSDKEEFEKLISEQVNRIIEAFLDPSTNNTYKRIVIPAGNLFFNTNDENIERKRTPVLYAILYSELSRLNDAVNGLDYDSYTNYDNINNTGYGKEVAEDKEGFEVSDQGDELGKAVDAKNATFAEGTTFLGMDISGKTIDEVYQSMIKKSIAGKEPDFSSILNLSRTDEDGNLLWENNLELLQGVPKKLRNDLLHYFNQDGVVPNITEEDLQNFSYYAVFKKLYELWASQNTDTIKLLREASKGKMLTDKTSKEGLYTVSQARALFDILNEADIKTQKTYRKSLRSAFLNRKIAERDLKNASLFNIEMTVSAEIQEKVDQIFSPAVRISRVRNIANRFVSTVYRLIQEERQAIQEKLKDDPDNEKLLNALASIDTGYILKKYTPKGIFDIIQKDLKKYVNADVMELTQSLARMQLKAYEEEVANGNRTPESVPSDQEILRTCWEIAQYRKAEYSKVVDDMDVYRALCEESCSQLQSKLGFIINATLDTTITNDKAEEIKNDINEILDGTTDKKNDEENKKATKDGWMTSFREVSNFNSLSQEVRRLIASTPNIDRNGEPITDDLGNAVFLDASYVHAVLLDKLRNILNPDDMLEALQNLSNSKPWVRNIIKAIKQNDSLYSKFYVDFRKDFSNYWIQKKTLNADGSFTFKTIALNRPEGIYYLLDAWRDNQSNGMQLSSKSLYDKLGGIDMTHAYESNKAVQDLKRELAPLSKEKKKEAIAKQKNIDIIQELLHRLGIQVDDYILIKALQNFKEEDNSSKFKDPIDSFLTAMSVIFEGVKNNKSEDEANEYNSSDLINNYGTQFNRLALIIADVSDDAIEQNVRQGDTTYYAHNTPNYLGKMMKLLKNVNRNDAAFMKMIEKEFGQYEWFKKNGKWRLDWLEQLVNNPEMRDAFQHKILLESGRVKYSDMGELDYTLAILHEFLSEDNLKEDSNDKMAWYYINVLADSPSGEFLKFRRYTDESAKDENHPGEYRTYQDIILEKLINVVEQEYDRICLVNERAEKIKKGEIKDVANYDKLYEKDSNGNYTDKVKRIGGAEFKFFPDLNTKLVTGLDGKQKLFLEALVECQIHESDDPVVKAQKAAHMQPMITQALKDIIESDFERSYQRYKQIGVLDKVEGADGVYKYFGKMDTTNLNTLAEVMLKAKQEIEATDPALWTKDMQNLYNQVVAGDIIDSDIARAVLKNIKDLIPETIDQCKTIKNPETFSRVRNNLRMRDGLKGKIKNFFYNNYLANANIIQLFATDLAYYSNYEDFIKRWKEIHAPALKLNTKAVFNGVVEGREYERTAYLKDCEIASSIKDEIRVVLDKQVATGRLSKIDRDFIFSQFDKVNVADAQAYRSLSSYRRILIMAGEWTNDYERAYNNIKNNTWDIRDFNIIWQTKKPYVYTQVGIDSHVDGHGNIKMGVQHKNSEFLLMASMALVAGTLGQSSKLRAINRFMEDNDIDVIQFESTTKVGKQGIINLNNVESEEAVYAKLDSACKINGVFNPDVVHTIPYEDYGIQTATPEHGIDAIQLVGTQLRKLIPADISDNAEFEIEMPDPKNKYVTIKRKFSKKELLDLYNAIITENIIQDFLEVDAIFKDPKQIERLLQEAIRSSNRYGLEMQRACTLNEKGVFNIPLFDPVISSSVQTLLNSIIKTRVNKQKSKGGAFIQVSNFGLTDQLHIVFKNSEGKNISKEELYNEFLQSGRVNNEVEWKRYLNEALESGDISIAYFECYMPAYSRQFYEPLMDPVTHQLDITKLPEDLRKAIGYRIPTENKYSMAPLYIKGFLPQQNGTAIMLPSEITTLSGSDFDVDKMYIMLPEFTKVQMYNMDRAIKDYYQEEFKKTGLTGENMPVSKELYKMIKDYVEKYGNQDGYEDNDDLWDELKLNYQGFEEQIDEFRENFEEWYYKGNQHKYRSITTFRKNGLDYTKELSEQPKAQRNNGLIDIMWSILTNKDTTAKILSPGNFVEQERVNAITKIYESTTEEQLVEVLQKMGVEMNEVKEITNELTGKKEAVNAPVYYYINKMPWTPNAESPVGIKQLYEQLKVASNPLSPLTQVNTHQNIMTGHTMIEIYAVHNASHGILQNTLVEVAPKFGFKLNGKMLLSLHGLYDHTGRHLISSNNASFVAASVDNGKNPTLAGLGQDEFTANVSMLLSRLGYTPMEIGLLMRQPIIREMSDEYAKNKGNDVSIYSIIQNALNKYKDARKRLVELQKEDDESQKYISMESTAWNNRNFTVLELSENLVKHKNLNTDNFDFTTPTYTKEELKEFMRHWSNQVAVGVLFEKMSKVGRALTTVVNATKADTSGGAIGPTIADTMMKIEKVKALQQALANTEHPFPLINANVIITDMLDLVDAAEDGSYSHRYIDSENNINVEALRKDLLNAPLPYIQAFYSLGLEVGQRAFQQYFPHYQLGFQKVISDLQAKSRTGRLTAKVRNNIYNDLFAYIMSKTEFFGASSFTNNNGEQVQGTSYDKRKDYINNFPKRLEQILDANPELKQLDLFTRLKIMKPTKNCPVSYIEFRNVGHMDQLLKDKFERDWISLLYHDNPHAKDIAMNLFLYCYYRNGFAFGPNTFSHLVPMVIRKLAPGYLDTLNDLINHPDMYDEFVDQYIQNHLYDENFVAPITGATSVIWLKKSSEGRISFVENVTIDVSKNKLDGDKMFIKRKKKNKDSKTTTYTFNEYIAITIAGDTQYYRLRPEKDGKPNTSGKASYVRIHGLGHKYSFIEYEYGVDASEMKSVIRKDKKRNKKETEKYKNDLEIAFKNQENNKASGESSDFYGDFLNLENEAVGSFDDFDSFMAEVNALDQYFNSNNESTENIENNPSESSKKTIDLNDNTEYKIGAKDNFSNYEPNYHYRDALGQEIC